MNVEHLNRVLTNWSDQQCLPKALYTIPNGSNPTGASMTLKRKQDIYSVNQQSIQLLLFDVCQHCISDSSKV
jgi:kynurenine/2-aminoadipate aminotransferase